MDLKKHLITEAPKSVYYIPNFVTEEYEKYIIEQIYKAPKPKWTCLSNRRLQNWGGLPHPKGMVQEPLPKWLQACLASITPYQPFGEARSANHVLINEYKPGQGILPHKDGPLYFPTVTTLSLGCHTFLDFYEPCEDGDCGPQKYALSLLLERRSLLLLKEDMYVTYLHGIEETDTDEFSTKLIANLHALGDKTLQSEIAALRKNEMKRPSTRLSLTMRYVPKVAKIKLKI